MRHFSCVVLASCLALLAWSAGIVAAPASGGSKPAATPASAASGGARRLTRLPGNERAPAWSPDGGRLAFETDQAGTWDLAVLDVARGAAGRVTDHAGTDRGPQFSPDGTELAFWSDRDGRPGVRILHLATGKIRFVAEAASEEAAPAWSPDGTTLAYAAGVLPETDIRLAGRDGRTRVLTSWPGRELWPRFSPDGRWVALFSRLESGDDDVYLVSADGASRRRVTRRPGHDFCPAWAPDGQRLAAAMADPAGNAIGIFDLQGRLLATLGRGHARATHPAWSPDGRRIAFAAREREGGFDILVEDVPPRAPAGGTGPGRQEGSPHRAR